MNATKTTKPKQEQRQSPEEMRAVLREMAEYAQVLQRFRQISGIPESKSDRYLPLFYNLDTVTSTALLQYYSRKIHSLKPKGRRGRPPKPPGDLLPSRNSRALAHALGDLAFTMSGRGTHWFDIAKACYPDKKPAELRTNAMRKHVARLIENGAIRARLRQKTGPE